MTDRKKPRPELTLELLEDAVRRLWLRSRVTESGCWVTDRGYLSGYSQVSIGGWPFLGHVVGYLHHKGPYDKGLELDHVDCESRACWNPDHVEPVTHEENMARYREKKYGTRKLPGPIWVRHRERYAPLHKAWCEANPERKAESDRASRIRNAPKRKQEDAERRANATNARKEWTDWEMEVAARTDITADEAAKMIGRSRKAVYAMRDKLRSKA